MEIISRKEAKELGLKRYFTGEPCKHGHASERLVSRGSCCACNAEYWRKYRKQNKDKLDKVQRKWREQSKGKLKENSRKHYEKNKERISENRRKYYEQNKEKVAKLGRKWRKDNPEQQFIRDSLKRCMDNFAGKRAKAEELLGYTCEQLREHIESQLKEGMSWENRSEWHIDHIKPIKAFLDEGITDPAIINALDNLQPLWAKDNLSKGAKYDE